MSKSLKNRIIARLDDTIAYFNRLPAQSGIAAGYNKRGVRYFTLVEAIISVSGAIDSVKEGRRARKRIIVRPSRYHKGVHELYTYHFPKAWSEACVNNRETIKLAQRLAHDLEHDPVAARPMRLRYLMQFYSPVATSSSASASSASASADGSEPKIYERFYQFAYVTILRSLYAAQASAQAAANASTQAATPSVACAANNSADEGTLSIAPEYYSGIALCAPPSHPVLAPSGCSVLATSGFPMLAPSGCPVLATFGSESVPPSSSPARSISCASISLCAPPARPTPASHRCPVLATSGSESVPLSSSPARSLSCASISLYAAQASAQAAAKSATDAPAEELSPSISPESYSGAPHPLSIAPASNAGITLCVPLSSSPARSISCASISLYAAQAAANASAQASANASAQAAAKSATDAPAEELSPSISPESYSGAPHPLSIAPASRSASLFLRPLRVASSRIRSIHASRASIP